MFVTIKLKIVIWRATTFVKALLKECASTTFLLFHTACLNLECGYQIVVEYGYQMWCKKII